MQSATLHIKEYPFIVKKCQWEMKDAKEATNLTRDMTRSHAPALRLVTLERGSPN